jgi:hypothetical protein
MINNPRARLLPFSPIVLPEPGFLSFPKAHGVFREAFSFETENQVDLSRVGVRGVGKRRLADVFV